jgi:hypothetical protein
MAKSAMQEQGVKDMAFVVVPHPVAGHNQDALQKMAEAAWTDILAAATQWQPQ